MPRQSVMSQPMPRKPVARVYPQYLKWRDGRPRWEPSPKLRALGHQGRDLKDAAGQWLSLGAAVDAAIEINANLVVDDAASTRAASLPPQERTVSALLDHIEKLPKFLGRTAEATSDPAKPSTPGEKPKRVGKRLSRTTRNNYRAHFKLIRAWSGDVPAAALKRSDFENFYEQLVQHRGPVMANRVMASVRMALNIAKDDLEWVTHNRAAKLDLLAEDGRRVMWTPEECITFILCADWMGMPSVGDAHLVGLMTAQSRKDVLHMPELELDRDVYRLPRAKTGQYAYIPATAPLMARIAMMRKRKAEMFPGVTYRHEIIDSRTGAPYSMDGSTFSYEHRQVRAVASGLQWAIDQAFPDGRPKLDYATAPFHFMPSIWEKRFQDLRDTAVTMLFDATGDIARVANISGHSLATAQAIIDKHYWVRNAGMSRAAGAQLEAFMKKIGFSG